MDTQTRNEALVAEGALSVTEAARFAGVSRSTLYELMSAGRIVFLTIGRRRVVPRRSVVEFLARQLEQRTT